jgi:hypothetical protein
VDSAEQKIQQTHGLASGLMQVGSRESIDRYLEQLFHLKKAVGLDTQSPFFVQFEGGAFCDGFK